VNGCDLGEGVAQRGCIARGRARALANKDIDMHIDSEDLALNRARLGVHSGVVRRQGPAAQQQRAI